MKFEKRYIEFNKLGKNLSTAGAPSEQDEKTAVTASDKELQVEEQRRTQKQKQKQVKDAK